MSKTFDLISLILRMMRTEDRHLLSCCSSYDGMTDDALLLRFENWFLAIKIYVVFWMDWSLSLGRCSSRGGLSTGIYLFQFWSNIISFESFIWCFLTRWVFTLPACRFAFSVSS